MNHVEFFPYVNRRISFKIDEENYKGVVLDCTERQRKHDYLFIPLEDLDKYRKAIDENDLRSQEEIHSIINIEFITQVELIKK